MSCFNGKMAIYSNISIDRFDGSNLEAAAYFLSHCHTDHMVGLCSDYLAMKFQRSPSTKLYVSEVTKILLMTDARYKLLENYIETLPIEQPKMLSFQVGSVVKGVTVTLLPAGHCPGSVMFLFEGDEGTALYTGDFRLPKGSAARMKCLHSGSKLKQIDHMHVDTTFCVPNAFYIPGREQCLGVLLDLVKEWTANGSDHVVRLNMSAKYGYEYLYEALYQEFKRKIYCARAEHYKCLPNIGEVLTSDPANAQIYACFKTEHIKYTAEKDWDQLLGDDDRKQNRSTTKLKCLYVTLSTLYFTREAKPEEVKVRLSHNKYRLCFSFHSSLSEVVNFISYLKPKSVHANVIPNANETFKTVEDRLKQLCFGEDDLSSSNTAGSPYKPFKTFTKKHAEHLPVTNGKASEPKRYFSMLLNASDSDDEIQFVPRKRKK